MYDGDEYEDQLLGDPNHLDNLIEGRDLNPLEDEQQGEEENEAEEQDQDKGDDSTKVKVKRKVVLNPQPKLDPVRLTGPRGIATMEGLFRDFKFIGHGYEEQDLKRIMERLELWGNRLFPKYQFDDLLEKVEQLGQKRPVMNFINKIRMGVVNEDSVAEGPADETDDVEMDLEADLAKKTERNAAASDDLFTQLIEEQLSQINSQEQKIRDPAPEPQSTITEEQRQRMLQNRRLAEERRLARLKAQQEKDTAPSTMGELSQANSTSEELNTIKPMETVGEAYSVIPIGKAEQHSVNENADASVNINEAVVSTTDEQNSKVMEISPTEDEKENADASVNINDAVVSTADEQNSKVMEMSHTKDEKENTDASVNINDAVVSTMDEQNSKVMEISPTEDEKEDRIDPHF